MRNYSFIDKLILTLERAFPNSTHASEETSRDNPAAKLSSLRQLSAAQQQETIRLMRVNHVGEVCAQALYQGQAAVAKDPELKKQLLDSAAEERDHLAWCAERVAELGGRLSYLNPLWYFGSYCIGSVFGILGDAVSLGFLAETETQVMAHLDAHMQRIPEWDVKSQAILAQMHEDEGKHAHMAMQSGGVVFPLPVKFAMRSLAKVMTKTAYWV